MSSEKTDSVYRNIAEEYAEKFSEPSEHIDEFLKRVPEDGRILDAGCGVGIDQVTLLLKVSKLSEYAFLKGC